MVKAKNWMNSGHRGLAGVGWSMIVKVTIDRQGRGIELTQGEGGFKVWPTSETVGEACLLMEFRDDRLPFFFFDLTQDEPRSIICLSLMD